MVQVSLLDVLWWSLGSFGMSVAPSGSDAFGLPRFSRALSGPLSTSHSFDMFCVWALSLFDCCFACLQSVIRSFSVVEAAPEARPKITPNARSALAVCVSFFHVWTVHGPL